MSKIAKINSIAERLGDKGISDILQRRLLLLDSPNVRLAITGGDNVGKSSLINALADVSLEVSFLPSKKTTRIVCQNQEVDADVIMSSSEWMSDNRLEIWELSYSDLPKEPKLIDFGLHFAHTDVCVFLLNAISALGRTEVMQLDVLDQLQVPTILVLSKANQLEDGDYQEVVSYLKQKTEKYHHVNFLEISEKKAIGECKNEICSEISDVLKSTGLIAAARQSIGRLFTIDALALLFEKCNKKNESIKDSVEKVDKLTAEKNVKMSNLTTTWMRLQNEVSGRKKETLQKVSEVFEKKKEDTVRVLKHQVEMCQDVKLFWEKELPYRFEDIVKANAQAASQLINVDVLNVINWLNSEIKRNFSRGLNSIAAINCTIEPDLIQSTENPNIADAKKMRIVARVGTAATVIAAGAMFATMGIGGIVMATGMVAGIGAEFFMGRKQSEAKKKVQALIPDMVEQAHQKLIIAVSDNLGKVYGEMIANLQACQKEWQEDSEKSIEKEKQIALYNVKMEAEKWKKCMEEINELSQNI